MDNTEHVVISKAQQKHDNRQDFPELVPFVDALNAAMTALGTQKAKVTYLERPGKQMGKPMDKAGFVPVTFIDGKPANGSEMRKSSNKDKRGHKDDLIR